MYGLSNTRKDWTKRKRQQKERKSEKKQLGEVAAEHRLQVVPHYLVQDHLDNPPLDQQNLKSTKIICSRYPKYIFYVLIQVCIVTW